MPLTARGKRAGVTPSGASKRPSGAAGRFRARLRDQALNDASNLGAMSPGLAAHFRQYGLTSDALCTYIAGLHGQKRALEPAEVARARKEEERIERQLRSLLKINDSNDYGLPAVKERKTK
jgi:hypothetical protein